MRKKVVEKELSACESVIMKVVWDAKEDIQLQDLMEALRVQYGKDYARTTVATFLQRLSDKGFVTTYRKGRISYTHALRSEEEYKNKMLREETDFWFQGNASKLMSALCKTKKLTKDEVQQIKEILDGMDD